jgi:CRISPR-associated endoribonuclease Cas6
MELKITFQNVTPTTIPINYQYYLGTWIYKIIASADESYAAFLHDEGYMVNNSQKKFKLVCFSNLYCPSFEMLDNYTRLKLKSTEISMKIRFKVDEALKNFVKGLFIDQTLQIKNGYDSMAEFKVSTVEMRDTDIVGDRTHLRAITPIVIGRKNARGNDDYLSPLDEGYEDLFFKNLFDRYIASGGSIKPEWQHTTPSIRVINPQLVKSRLLTLKEGRKDETKVKGFLYDFEIVAPREIIEASYLGGFGKECSWGFGFCEEI